MKKEAQEGKKPDKHHQNAGNYNQKCRPLILCTNRELYKTFKPLTQDILVVMAKMEVSDLSTLPTLRNSDAQLGSDRKANCRYHCCKGHTTDNCKILKRDIENLIPRVFSKNLWCAGKEVGVLPVNETRHPERDQRLERLIKEV